MAIQHEDITDPKIHEPKGISSASAGTVYVAGGTGSGAWQKVTSSSLDMTQLNTEIQTNIAVGDIAVESKAFFNITLNDISTASSVIIPVPHDVVITNAVVVLGGAITVADASVSFKNSSGASMGAPVLVEFDSSAKGDTYTWTATGSNTIPAGSWIEVETNGASTGAVPCYVTVEFGYQIN